MFANHIQVVSISNQSNTGVPLAGQNGSLGPIALASDVNAVSAILTQVSNITASLQTQIVNTNAVTVYTLPNSASNLIDFIKPQTVGILNGLSGTCTFVTANISAGRVYGLRIKSPSSQAVLFPNNFMWLTAAPSGTTAGKWMILTMESLGNTNSDILIDWKNQP